MHTSKTALNKLNPSLSDPLRSVAPAFFINGFSGVKGAGVTDEINPPETLLAVTSFVSLDFTCEEPVFTDLTIKEKIAGLCVALHCRDFKSLVHLFLEKKKKKWQGQVVLKYVMLIS